MMTGFFRSLGNYGMGWKFRVPFSPLRRSAPYKKFDKNLALQRLVFRTATRRIRIQGFDL